MKTQPDWQFAATDNRPDPKTRPLVRMAIVLAFLNLIIVIGIPLARVYLQAPEIMAFRFFFNALMAGIILAALGLLMIIITAMTNNRFATRGGGRLLLPGLLPAAAVAVLIGPGNLIRPNIGDITTDTENPPQFVEVKKIRGVEHNPVDYAGARFSARQQSAYPDIQPIATSMNTDDALTEAIQVVKDLGWEFINIDYDRGIVEAMDQTSYGSTWFDTSRIFKMAGDVIIKVQREGTGSRVDVRSASRLGPIDFGKNADRVRLFMRSYRS